MLLPLPIIFVEKQTMTTKIIEIIDKLLSTEINPSKNLDYQQILPRDFSILNYRRYCLLDLLTKYSVNKSIGNTYWIYRRNFFGSRYCLLDLPTKYFASKSINNTY